MSTFIYKALCCLILIFTSGSLAKMVTISGTVTDTVLETGSGKEPVLKVIPVEACSISISAGCTETVLDKYFVKTDKSGYYSLTVNLPDECTYPTYLFRIDGKAGSKTITSSVFGIPVDSMKSSLKKDLYVPHQIPWDSVKTTEYAHQFNLITNNVIRGGDTMVVYHKILGLSDNADTLHFNKCKHRILLLTSSNDTVYNSDFNCKDSGSWLHLQKGWSTSYSFKVPVPVDLQKTNASFVQDRKLTLELKLNDHDITYTTPAFLVIDTDIKIDNGTAVRTLKQSMDNRSKTGFLARSNQLHLVISQPGIYSIALFSLDGRSVGHIVKDQYFSAGEHLFKINNISENSSKLLIAKFKGNGFSASTLINNF
ncbi:MAG TPA: hypothetical protein VHO70_13605 [Chitinispirillaceae bacterium]|nr:hypothetical protein [Chitinispirillaceae bacterium]